MVGVDVVEVGDLVYKRHTDVPTARWTITSPKPTAGRNTLRVDLEIPEELATLAETAILLEMTALEETALVETTRKGATIAGPQAIPDLIGITTNE